MGFNNKIEYSTSTKALYVSEIAQLLQNKLEWMTKAHLSHYTPSTHTVTTLTHNISLHTTSQMDTEAPLKKIG